MLSERSRVAQGLHHSGPRLQATVVFGRQVLLGRGEVFQRAGHVMGHHVKQVDDIACTTLRQQRSQ